MHCLCRLMADCVESEYRLDPIFSALQVRFSDADVGRLVICARLNGDRSKSIRPERLDRRRRRTSPKAHPPLRDILISIKVSLVSLSFILGYEGERFCGR
jgi:hypothetical protein